MNKRLLITTLFTFALVCSSSKMYSMEMNVEQDQKSIKTVLIVDLKKNKIELIKEKIGHITVLTITDDQPNSQIFNKTLLMFSTLGVNLQEIHLHDCKNITRKGIDHLIKNCKKLKKIYINNCVNFKDQVLTLKK